MGRYIEDMTVGETWQSQRLSKQDSTVVQQDLFTIMMRARPITA